MPCLFCLKKIATAKFNEKGAVIDAGADLNAGSGFAEWILNLIILTGLCQVFALFWIYLWVGWLLVSFNSNNTLIKLIKWNWHCELTCSDCNFLFPMDRVRAMRSMFSGWMWPIHGSAHQRPKKRPQRETRKRKENWCENSRELWEANLVKLVYYQCLSISNVFNFVRLKCFLIHIHWTIVHTLWNCKIKSSTSSCITRCELKNSKFFSVKTAPV